MFIYKLLRDILKLDMGEKSCYKITDTKYLYVENWCSIDDKWFTTLELVNGEDVNDVWELYETLEIITLDYKNKAELKEGIKLILKLYKIKYK